MAAMPETPEIFAPTHPTPRTGEPTPLSPNGQEAPQEGAKKNKRGASPERMKELLAIRMEKAKTDPSVLGGRPRTKYSRKEVEARALERMMPKALKVLDQQLESLDERVRQSAAVKVLEYVKGKPVTPIAAQIQNVTKITYEAAAWDPEAALGEGFPIIEAVVMDEADLPALPEAPEESF